jgi:hypothetical protein
MGKLPLDPTCVVWLGAKANGERRAESGGRRAVVAIAQSARAELRVCGAVVGDLHTTRSRQPAANRLVVRGQPTTARKPKRSRCAASIFLVPYQTPKINFGRRRITKSSKFLDVAGKKINGLFFPWT